MGKAGGNAIVAIAAQQRLVHVSDKHTVKRSVVRGANIECVGHVRNAYGERAGRCPVGNAEQAAMHDPWSRHQQDQGQYGRDA